MDELNYEKFGIVVTLIIVFITSGFIGVTQFGLVDIPQIGVNIPDIIPKENTFYEWCYKMKIEC